MLAEPVGSVVARAQLSSATAPASVLPWEPVARDGRPAHPRRCRLRHRAAGAILEPSRRTGDDVLPRAQPQPARAEDLQGPLTPLCAMTGRRSVLLLPPL